MLATLLARYCIKLHMVPGRCWQSAPALCWNVRGPIIGPIPHNCIGPSSTSTGHLSGQHRLAVLVHCWANTLYHNWADTVPAQGQYLFNAGYTIGPKLHLVTYGTGPMLATCTGPMLACKGSHNWHRSIVDCQHLPQPSHVAARIGPSLTRYSALWQCCQQLVTPEIILYRTITNTILTNDG